MPYLAAKVANRIQETSSTVGTGNFTLDGAVPKFNTFDSAFNTGDLVYYSIVSVNGSQHESGIGTFTAPSTLARTTPRESTNSNNLVNFSGGLKVVTVSPTGSWGEDIITESVNQAITLSIALG
jgi:hypothetical protein